MSAFCVFQRPSHTLSKRLGAALPAPSNLSCWPPQGTARPLLLLSVPRGQGSLEKQSGRAEMQFSEGAQNWPQASWPSYSLSPGWQPAAVSLYKYAARSTQLSIQNPTSARESPSVNALYSLSPSVTSQTSIDGSPSITLQPH